MESPDPAHRWNDATWQSRDGLRLHYRDYAGPGDRVPILCLHGLTRNARDFEELAPWLARNRRVIVPDFRGRGTSDFDPVPARYAPPTYAGDVLQLLELLDIPRAVFIGTSLGGLVTMAIAMVAADRVAGVVLNDVGPELLPQGLDRIRGYVGKPARFRDWSEAAAAIADANRPLHPGFDEADWMTMTHRLCRETSDGIVFDYDPAIAINVLASADAPQVDAWPIFDALTAAPLLIVRGELSDLLSETAALAMANRHRQAELVTVPATGHAPNLSEAEAMAGIERLLWRVRN